MSKKQKARTSAGGVVNPNVIAGAVRDVSVQVRMNRIYPIMTRVRNPGFNSIDQPIALTFNVRFVTGWEGDDMTVTVEFRVSGNESDAVESIGPLIDVAVACEFIIVNLTDFPRTKDGGLAVPRGLIAIILGQTYSTTRGWLAAKAQGLRLDKLILPLMDDGELYDKLHGDSSAGLELAVPARPSMPTSQVLRSYLVDGAELAYGSM